MSYRSRSPSPRRSSRYSPDYDRYYDRGGYGGRGYDRYHDRGGYGGRSYDRGYDRSPPRRKGPMFRERDLRDSTTLFIGNLPYHVRDRDLADQFSKCGRLRSVTVGFNKRTGQSKGYGFVEFESRQDAEDAYDRFNGYSMEGRRLRIDWDAGLNKKQAFFGYPPRNRSPPRRRSSSPRRRTPTRSPRRSPSPDRARRSPSPAKRSPADSPRSGSRSRSPVRRSPSPRRSPRASPEVHKRSRSPPSRSPSPGADKRRKLDDEPEP